MSDRHIIDVAREEWEEDGVIATDTFMKLTAAGINGNVLIAQFETERENT